MSPAHRAPRTARASRERALTPAALARRRVPVHLLTWSAVGAAVLVTLTVAATLVLLGGAIGDAAGRGLVLERPEGERSLRVTTTVPAAHWPQARAALEALAPGLGPGSRATAAITASTFGVRGQPERVRAVLVEAPGLPDRAEVTAGTWPQTTASGILPVAVHAGAAQALGLTIGDTLALTDLITPTRPTTQVRIVGLFQPRDLGDPLWQAWPSAAAGVTHTDFDTVGPLLAADGALAGRVAGAVTLTGSLTPDLTGLDAADLPRAAERARATQDALRLAVRAGEPLAGGEVSGDLPRLLAAASATSARAALAQLTPTSLLLVLGGVALVVSVALLALLRSGDTGLLRTRGATSRQLAGQALREGAVLIGVATVIAVLLAPLLATPLARATGLPTDRFAAASVVTDRTLWFTVALTDLAALALLVGTTLARSPARLGAAPSTRALWLRVLSTAGGDLALLALGVLAVLQMRRYAAATEPVLDPLTVLAPAVLVMALAVVALRVLPLLTRAAAWVGQRSRTLEPAWGGWQLARRLGDQAGSLLLILLAVPMAVLVVAQGATTQTAFADQSAFRVGAPMAVQLTPTGGADLATPTRLAEIAGGAHRVVTALRDTQQIGSLDRVTVLAVDAARAATTLDPRPDLVPGPGWAGLMQNLTAGRGAAAAALPAADLPRGARELTLRVRSGFGDGVTFVGPVPPASLRVVLRDAAARVVMVDLGEVPTPSPGVTRTVALPEGLVEPASVLAVDVRSPVLGALHLEVVDLGTDGGAIGGVQRWPAANRGDQVLVTPPVTGATPGVTPGATPIPAVVTDAVAEDLGVRVGGDLAVTVQGRRLTARIVGTLRQLPSAQVPARGILLDLPTLSDAVNVTARDTGHLALVPTEAFLDPVDPAAAQAALTRDRTLAAGAVSASGLLQAREAHPVNAGVRAALVSVALAALGLTALGFAATTTALGRTRRRESAILLSLGMPPRRIRRTLLLERLAVTVVAVAAGIALGVVLAVIVVPLLVGADGQSSTLPVRVVIPPAPVAGVALGCVLVLGLTALAVTGRVNRDLAATVREEGPA